jgi:hypothetical protein
MKFIEEFAFFIVATGWGRIVLFAGTIVGLFLLRQ